MDDGFDRRTFDLLRLVGEHEPIGSIRLVDLMQRQGYSIKGRTVRLTLSELDERGLTEKVPGRGRRLTDLGRDELYRGDVRGRLEQVRSRIGTLTSKVDYDVETDDGSVVAAEIVVSEGDLPAALDRLRTLSASPLGPIRIDVDRSRNPRRPRVLVPSSVTLDGVLRRHGVDVDVRATGIVEYHPEPTGVPYDDSVHDPMGGAILRYVDALDANSATMDVIELLIEAGRTDVRAVLDGTVPAPIVVDNREASLVHLPTIVDVANAVRDRFGGVIDVRRPREAGPFPLGAPGWNRSSITYGGPGELALALLVEQDLAVEYSALSGVVDGSRFGLVDDLAELAV